MKKFLFFWLLGATLFLSLPVVAQDELTDLINQGVDLNDAGKYPEALKKYEQALLIDKKSSRAYYEIGYTYQAMKQYDNAIKAYDKVIKMGEKDETLLLTYMNKASILDDAGKPKEAVKLYKKGIEIYPDHYLLHFNLGITYTRLQEYDLAETALDNAILLNTAHASSHRLLGYLQTGKGNRVQGLLALYFFLLIEPKTERGIEVYNEVMEQLQKGATIDKKPDGSVTININPAYSESSDTTFGNTEMVLSMSVLAWETINTNEQIAKLKGTTDEQFFVDVTNTFFGNLMELQAKSPKQGIYWDLYVTFFAKLQKAGHTEAFCYHISQSKGAVVDKWMKENGEKIDAFYTWLQSQ